MTKVVVFYGEAFTVNGGATQGGVGAFPPITFNMVVGEVLRSWKICGRQSVEQVLGTE